MEQDDTTNSSAAPLAREPDGIPAFKPEAYDPREQNPNRADSPIREKWGWKTLTLGFTAVPNILLMTMGRSACTPMEFTVLVQLMRYWWKPDDWPYPSVGRLAEDIGVSDKTVRRTLAGLAKHQIIERYERRNAHDRSQTNIYSLAPLVHQFEMLAIKHIADTDFKRAAMLFPTDPEVFPHIPDRLPSDDDQIDVYESLIKLRAARGTHPKEKA